MTDSGGPGIHRGGLGVRRDHRILDHQAEASILGNRVLVPPWGLDGGGSGKAADYRLDVDTPNDRPAAPRFRSKGTMIALEPGTLITQTSAGGGGWGDPSKRDPERVARDVKLNFVSREAAERDYRVALSDDGTVDPVRTRALRRGGE